MNFHLYELLLKIFYSSFLSLFLSLTFIYLMIVYVEYYCCIWSHTHTHTHTHTTLCRNPLDEWSALRRQTSMPPLGIRTSNPSSRAAPDPRLRPPHHWDGVFFFKYTKCFIWISSKFQSLTFADQSVDSVLQVWLTRVVAFIILGKKFPAFCLKLDHKRFLPHGSLFIRSGNLPFDTVFLMASLNKLWGLKICARFLRK